VCARPKTGGGRGIFGWILIIGGVVVGLIVILGLVGYVMTKRQQQQQAMYDAAGIPMPAPVSKPPKSKPPKAASLPPATAVVSAAGQAPQQPVAAVITGPRFYVMSGPRTGEQIALKHGFMIGKQPGCDLVIDDGYTSTQHAQVGMDHFGNCRVYDRNSTNGTFVNGQRISEYALEHGMVVRIGSTDLRFLAQ
jgi:hypothetical protein